VCFEKSVIHTDFYFNTEKVSQIEYLKNLVTVEFISLCQQMSVSPDWVVSYRADVADGSIFAKSLGDGLKKPSAYVDLRTPEKSFTPSQNDKVLIVADDIVSGGSLGKTIEYIESQGASVIPEILTLGNLSSSRSYKNFRLTGLFEQELKTWGPEECPLCKKGSIALKARSDWAKIMPQD
jgi:orotate phosphoribosyltransferase